MVANAGEDQRNKERVKISLDRATAIFAERNIRFTDLRRKVFEEIASNSSQRRGVRGPGSPCQEGHAAGSHFRIPGS